MAHLRWVMVLGLSVACEAASLRAVPRADDSDPPDPVVAEDDTDDDTDEDAVEPPADDEAIARAVIAGELRAAEGLHDVAWSGGWPVRTAAGTFLFVLQDAGAGWAWAGEDSGWTPVPMSRGAADVWWLERDIGAPAGSTYKFVQDATTWIDDPVARSYDYDDNGAISYVRPPTDDFRLDRWPGLVGGLAASRDVTVWVPPGQGPWPLLVAHDGQNLFDPSAIEGGWRLRQAVRALPQPMLVVGIDHAGARRIDEFAHTTDVFDGQTYGGGAEVYATLVHDVVRPHVERVYGPPVAAGVMGSSMGGLVSLYLALERPDLWDFAASLSGALRFGRVGASNPTMQELWVQAGVVDVAVYVDSGGGDGGDGCTDPDGDGFAEDDPNDSDDYCMTRSFADALAGEGYVWDVSLWHWHEPGAAHGEAAWAARVGRPLAAFLEQVP